MIEPNIFRAYDIRGTVPEQMNPETVRAIGKAFGTWIKRRYKISNPRICVGRDGRIHSTELKDALIQGLMSVGCHVTDIDLSPTPLLYFSSTFGNFDGGCAITASHNPKEYNGVKCVERHAHNVFGDDLKTLYQMIERSDFEDGEGKFVTANFLDDYLKKLHSILNFQKPLKIVLDTANGVSGPFYPGIFKSFGHKVITINEEVDGTFPNHEPDPIVEKILVLPGEGFSSRHSVQQSMVR